MKTSFALLSLTLVAVALQTTWASPQFSFNIGVGGNLGIPYFNDYARSPALSTDSSNSADVNDASSTAAAQEQSIIENIVNGISDALSNANEAGQNVAKDFIQNIRDATDSFLANANDFGESLGNSFKELVEQNVVNFRAVVHAVISSIDREILAVRNRLKLRALHEVEARLEDLYSSINSLHGYVENLRANWQHNMEHQEMILVRGWNLWAGDQLEKVAEATNGDEEKLSEAENIVNEFVNRYGNYLVQCTDEMDAELTEYEEQVDSIIARYDPILGGLMNEVDQCLKGEDTSAEGRRCSRRFKESLRQLSSVPSEVAKLTATGTRLANERFENNYCVAQTLIEFNLEKYSIERKVAALTQPQDESDDDNGAEEDDNAEEKPSESIDQSASSGSNESLGNSQEQSAEAE